MCGSGNIINGMVRKRCSRLSTHTDERTHARTHTHMMLRVQECSNSTSLPEPKGYLYSSGQLIVLCTMCKQFISYDRLSTDGQINGLQPAQADGAERYVQSVGCVRALC